ncbi:MAG: HAD-IA family hydrolase [Alphaproteobacteria bacterium]|nr:HAD-IA family hydrolase [Alphaproteobacteria bacterium]
MTRGLRLAVFDCDGTIVDSQHAIVAGVAAACEALGLVMPAAEQIKRGVGLPLKVGIGRLFPDHGPDLHDRLVQFYRDNFVRLRQRPEHVEPLFPGLIETFDALKQAGFLLGVATGKARRGLIATLERHALVERFDVLQTADDAPGKPHPGMLLNAMSRLGVSPDATVMIGDTTFDIEMARAAKVAPIGVAWGYHEAHELTEAGALTVVQTGDALARTLLNWADRVTPGP